MNFKLYIAALSTLFLTTSVQAQHSWVQPYVSLQDSPFHEFGLMDTLSIEDFEDGELNVPGVTLSSIEAGAGGHGIHHLFGVRIQPHNSVAEDTGDPDTGAFLLGRPLGCATTFPLLCSAKVTLQFDPEPELPTFAGFVWTDAVLSTNPESGLPFGLVTAFVGEEDPIEVARVFDLPTLDPDDPTADDLFIGLVDYRGIDRLEFRVISDLEGGNLSMDHLQFGRAATPGDANRDGAVEFDDFLTLADNFGLEGDWSQGDFNFNGTVEFLDFLNLASHFGETNANVAAVPEPTAVALAVLACMSLLCRRPRRGQ